MPGHETFNKQDYIYTPLFCEENIWQLCRSLTSTGIPADQLRVLFLSNSSKDVIVMNQQFTDPHAAVAYDYHVILKYYPDDETLLFDFDSRLPFPIDWKTYQLQSFPDQASLPPGQCMMIRDIPADEYLECFTSDRSHMAHLPQSEHPHYECIQASNPDCSIDISEYWQMHKAIRGASKVYPYEHLLP
jgi:hypothetical protein